MSKGVSTGVADGGRQRARLRVWLAVFLLALAVPSAVLVYLAYDQLKWESFRREQLVAEDLSARIDRGLVELALREDARPPADYGFLVHGGNLPAAGERLSPLSRMPPTEIPGLLGWFQVGEDGAFSTPLLPGPGLRPADFGIGPEDLARRQAQAQRMLSVLADGRLAELEPPGEGAALAKSAAPAPTAPAVFGGAAQEAAVPRAQARAKAPAETQALSAPQARLSQAAIERLAAADAPAAAKDRAGAGRARVGDLALDPRLANRGLVAGREESKGIDERESRADKAEPYAFGQSAESTDGKEEAQHWAAPLPSGSTLGEAQSAETRVPLFGGSREPMRLGRLGSGHLVLFRRARIGGERVVQGALIEEGPFLARMVGGPYGESDLATNADLTVAYRDELLISFRARGPSSRRVSSVGYPASAKGLTGSLLYRTRAGDPFGGLALIFSVKRLPAPPGAWAIGAVGASLALVLVGGTWFMERLGSRQIELARQQQSFVSAVSHELKTPLTSIRMYAEMLGAGLADESRRPVYYRYIQEESERLSRLIANVLALSRIGRGRLAVSPRPMAVDGLMDSVRERIAVPAERAGFRVELECQGQGLVMADPDAFQQILLNLVDNALKFAADCEPKVLEIRCALVEPKRGRACWRFSVRDYGPGIPKAQRRRVFRLFHRGDDAVRRAVSGTGIGLALVEQLVLAMGGRVEAVGREPGVELRVELPAAGEAVLGAEPHAS